MKINDSLRAIVVAVVALAARTRMVLSEIAQDGRPQTAGASSRND